MAGSRSELKYSGMGYTYIHSQIPFDLLERKTNNCSQIFSDKY